MRNKSNVILPSAQSEDAFAEIQKKLKMAKPNEAAIPQKKNFGVSITSTKVDGAMEEENSPQSSSVYINIVDKQATIVPKEYCQPLKSTSKQISNYLENVNVISKTNSVIGPKNTSIFMAAKMAQKSDSDEELNLLTDIKERRDTPLFFMNYDKPSPSDIESTKSRLIVKYGEVKTESIFSSNLEVLNTNLVPILKSSKTDPDQFCKNLNILLHYVYIQVLKTQDWNIVLLYKKFVDIALKQISSINLISNLEELSNPLILAI